MAIQISTPTPSQEASAAMHLDRAAEWRTIRVDGTRYVVLPSGNSGRTYWVRATADGCSCLYYERTGRTCSHMLAVERSAMLEELAENLGIRTVRGRFEDLYPQCRTCSDSVDRAGERCLVCLETSERAQRQAAARAQVMEAWVE
jgi:hypothetical protein